jgi:hypothetical protein|nr:hypothetical protein [Actinophrys sol]
MIIKNFNISLKYFLNMNIVSTDARRLLVYKLYNRKLIKKINTKNYCIYTGRYRSVYSFYKMSRHQLKSFLDNKTFSNIFVK